MPMADCPLDCSKPITSQAKFLIRNRHPAGRSPNNSLCAPWRRSRKRPCRRAARYGENRPSASCQLPHGEISIGAAGHRGRPVRAAYTTVTLLLATGATALIELICAAMASASLA